MYLIGILDTTVKCSIREAHTGRCVSIKDGNVVVLCNEIIANGCYDGIFYLVLTFMGYVEIHNLDT